MEKKGYTIGGVIPKGGTAHEYSTGGWRKLRPVVNKDKCTNCLI
ncbi:partial pyruvate ferredoxin oxidoreductase delta subunit, partial [uncultured bacterium]